MQDGDDNVTCYEDVEDCRSPLLLLGLPGPGQHNLAAQLTACERRSLRLVCALATTLVDCWATQLRLRAPELLRSGARVQQRYPNATQLIVQGEDERWETAHSDQLAAAAVPWRTITSVTLRGGSMRAAARALALLPNTKHLCLHGLLTTSQQPSLVALCQRLPGLTSLVMSLCQAVADEQLQALAALPALKALDMDVSRGGTGEEGWDALGSMTALQSLSIEHNGSFKEAVWLDLRSFAALTQLTWQRELIAQELTGQAVRLQLPSSLMSLYLDHLPATTTLPVLCHLTSLTLKQQQVGQPQLAWLSSSCTSLTRLVLPSKQAQLQLTAACHTTPLHALTELRLGSEPQWQRGVQLARVLPQLQLLQLQALATEHQLPEHHTPFEGLVALTRLDIGCSSNGAASLSAADTQALAALPALSVVRMYVTPQNVQCMQWFGRLRSVELLWAIDVNAWGLDRQLQQLLDAFANSSVPPLLRSAAFVLTMGYGPRHAHIIEALTDAGMAWLARAPALQEFTWTAYTGSAINLTPAKLVMLSRFPCVQRFVIDSHQKCSVELGAEVRAMVHELCAHGLVVQVLGD